MTCVFTKVIISTQQWQQQQESRTATMPRSPFWAVKPVPYPADWKNIFATKGFMIALHVPAVFAKHKNKLSRALYRAGKKVDVKKPWDFIEEIKSSGYGQQAADDPLSILKIRLAKGEINPQEYEKLRQTLTT